MNLGATLVRPPSVATPARRRGHAPTWVKPTLAIFCLVQIVLLGSMRATSGLAHLRAIQSMADPSPLTAAAACVEGTAAVDDFWPAVPLLGMGRLLPFGTARAWGQLPLLVDVARGTCPAIRLYATIAPAPDRSIADGATADLLASIRHNESELAAANAQLASAWRELDGVDLSALSADARLARVAGAIATARQQQADVSDALALATPERLETLLGGRGPRAMVLRLLDGTADAQAYAVLRDGQVETIQVGQPSAAVAVLVAVDSAGLNDLVSTIPHAEVPAGASDGSVASAVLAGLARAPFGDQDDVASALRRSADDHHAWMWFEDPALRAMATRHGWVLE
jgi:hypothetical protein